MFEKTQNTIELDLLHHLVDGNGGLEEGDQLFRDYRAYSKTLAYNPTITNFSYFAIWICRLFFMVIFSACSSAKGSRFDKATWIITFLDPTPLILILAFLNFHPATIRMGIAVSVSTFITLGIFGQSLASFITTNNRSTMFYFNAFLTFHLMLCMIKITLLCDVYIANLGRKKLMRRATDFRLEDLKPAEAPNLEKVYLR